MKSLVLEFTSCQSCLCFQNQPIMWRSRFTISFIVIACLDFELSLTASFKTDRQTNNLSDVTHSYSVFTLRRSPEVDAVRNAGLHIVQPSHWMEGKWQQWKETTSDSGGCCPLFS